MGASVGTGMQTRRFAEGGAATGSEGATQGATQAAPQRAIYRPQYTDYSAGLSSTPQAEYLASRLGMQQPGTFTPQMPTFTRPQAVQQAPSYSIPYTNYSPSSTGIGRIVTNSNFEGLRGTPEQQAAALSKSIQEGNLTQSQYDKMMADPGRYLSYVQAVQAGDAPDTISYQQQPIKYMTAEQQQAYNNKLKRELDQAIRPITVFQEQSIG